MYVGVADSAGMHFHQHLIRSRLRLRNIFDLPRTADCGNDCSYHNISSWRNPMRESLRLVHDFLNSTSYPPSWADNYFVHINTGRLLNRQCNRAGNRILRNRPGYLLAAWLPTLILAFSGSKSRAWLRSSMSPICVGRQPSRSRVSALDEGRSAPTKYASHPKCSAACSAVSETAGTFRPRPIASAIFRTGTPSS